jgi:hypothetical protein
VLCGGNASFLPSLPATAATPGPAEGNFGEKNVCTGVDAQECARMANVLSVENAVKAEEIAVQAEEIARLRGLLETHTSHGNQRVNHEKILEPMGIVDHSPHGALRSLLPTSITSCLCLALKLTAVVDHFDSRYLILFIYAAHFKFLINGRIFSLSKRHNRKIWTRKEVTPSQIRWCIANLSSGTKSISQTPAPKWNAASHVGRNILLQSLTLRHPTKFSNASVPKSGPTYRGQLSLPTTNPY